MRRVYIPEIFSSGPGPGYVPETAAAGPDGRGSQVRGTFMAAWPAPALGNVPEKRRSRRRSAPAPDSGGYIPGPAARGLDRGNSHGGSGCGLTHCERRPQWPVLPFFRRPP